MAKCNVGVMEGKNISEKKKNTSYAVAPRTHYNAP